MGIQNIIKNVGKIVNDYSPQILTGLGVAGVVSTAVLAVKATPEAVRRIDERAIDRQQALSTVDKFKETWTLYIPAASVGSLTIACIIFGNQISSKRNAALMSLWTLTETNFREYQDKVTQTVGAKKEEDIRAEVAKDKLARMENKEVVIIGNGDVLFMDDLSGRTFMSTMETVRSAQNDINEKVLNSTEGSATLNEFWHLIGLPTTGYGEEVGWSTDNTLDIKYAATITQDNRPCIVIEFRKVPTRGYYVGAPFLN
jgi:hypothetical protein